MIALLYTQKVYAKTHQGARAKIFYQNAIFPIETSDTIAILFDYGQQADYDLDEDITYEEGLQLTSKANGFYQLVLGYYQKLIGDTH